MIRAIQVARVCMVASLALSGQAQAATIQYTAQERFVTTAFSILGFPPPPQPTDRKDAADFTAFNASASLASDSNSANAHQLSALGANSISGQGTASIQAFSGLSTTVTAESRMKIDFTLGTSVNYDLSGLLTGTFTFPGFRSQNNGGGVAHVELTNANSGVIFSDGIGGSISSFGTRDLAHSGVLAAGDYTLLAFITASGSFSSLAIFSGGGTAAPAFSFALTTTPVPLPGSLGLLAVALAGLARMTVQRTRVPERERLG